MRSEIIYHSAKLIDKLEDLYKKGEYIFRGQPNARYKLLPSAFRDDKLQEAAKNFPVPEKEIKEKWFSNKRISESISGWSKHNRNHIESFIVRVLRYGIILRRYNYGLCYFYEKNPEVRNLIDQTLIDRYKGTNYWTDEENFISWFDGYAYPKLVTRLDLKGNILQEAHPPKDVTGFDETFPQHYGFSSAALDWSYNPYIAIYFALGNEVYDKNSGLYIAPSALSDAEYLAVYAYKKIADAENSPIIIKNRCEFKGNMRAVRQEGTFTYFDDPFSFYLYQGELPYIEKYDGHVQPSFELIKLNLLRNETNLTFLKKLLEQRGINESFLFPDKQDIISN